MSKQILPFEMAEIVAGLLTNPSAMGYFDEVQQHEAFFKDIAQVVVDHCGGQLIDVHDADYYGEEAPYLSSPEASPMAAIAFCEESIGDPHACIYSPYDPTGWEDDVPELEKSKTIHEGEMLKQRSDSLSILLSKSISDGVTLDLDYEMQDWDEDDQSDGSARQCQVSLSNQIYITLQEKGNAQATEFIVEICKGRPCVHLSHQCEENDEVIAHVIDNGAGFVITPDHDQQHFESYDSGNCHYAYHSQNAIRLTN